MSPDSKLNKPKVFGIGLSKTGTHSLVEALNILGWRAVHYPPAGKIMEIARQADALVEMTVIPRYKLLDVAFPNSLFILTRREMSGWLESCRTWWARGDYISPESLRNRRAVFGIEGFDPIVFKMVHLAHILDVTAHFYTRKDKLLELDICGGGGWDKLCKFLNCPVPSVPFPHKNKWNR